jgi:DNA-3-methyladenine glycosylase II
MDFTMRPRGVTNFALSARVLQRTRKNRIDEVDEEGVWSRVVPLTRGPVLLRCRQEGALLRVQAEGASAETTHALSEDDEAQLRVLIERMFALSRDLRPFFRAAHADPAFADMADRCAGLRPQRFATLFEAIANALCCQQLSLESGLTTLSRIAERFGPRLNLGRGRGVRFGPPDPQRVAKAPPGSLRELGMSSRRGGYLQALARSPLHAFEAELDRLSYAAARRQLLELPGIGPWSADYILLRGMGKLELFPGGDVGAANALSRILGRKVSPADAPGIAESFAPMQGMLYFCMRGVALA